MSITFDLWSILVGAAAGALAAHFARGRNVLFKAAGIGALVAVVATILQRFVL